MRTHLNPRSMKLLRECFPHKDGKRIIRSVNFYLTDDNGKLIIDNNVREEIVIENYEFAITALYDEKQKNLEILGLERI